MSTPFEACAIIYDCDGPICDSYDLGFAAIEQVALLKNLTFDDAVRDLLHYHWGLPGFKLFSECMGTTDEEGVEHYALWHELDRDNQPPIIPGARECLQLFHERGVPQTMLTSRPTKFIMPWLQHVDIVDFFVDISTTCKSKFHKPHRRSFDRVNRVLSAQGVHLKSAVFVGDTHIDWKAGVNRGVTTFIVRTGPFGRFGPEKWGLEIPDERLIDSIADLPQRLIDLNMMRA